LESGHKTAGVAQVDGFSLPPSSPPACLPRLDQESKVIGLRFDGQKVIRSEEFDSDMQFMAR
jgi:hypothetical protein